MALTTLVALSGCAGPSPFGERYQTEIPAGSVLVLSRSLDLVAGSARVTMQDGQVRSDGLLAGTSRFRPRCSFGLERLAGEPLIRTIEPDRFRTGRPHTRAYVHNGRAERTTVASRSLAAVVGSMRRGGPNPGYLTYVLEIPLSSPRQPQVDDFTCKVDRPGNWRGRLGLEAIREAAAGIVRVELAP